ncbi:hypothetical protein, partial [Enterobacter roggenkampii]|uniref:hypothetical protein n=1 Tax=Enterobacter roggenkampii TaxID=1812935 RepID=UPI002074D38E
RKRAYCLKIQPATGSFARNLIYSTKPLHSISFYIHGAIPCENRWHNEKIVPTLQAVVLQRG